MSFNRKDNIKKGTFEKENVIHLVRIFTKLLKRQNILILPHGTKWIFFFFPPNYVLGTGIWRKNANSPICLTIGKRPSPNTGKAL